METASFSRSYKSYLAQKATDKSAPIMRTIAKTFDYIDGGFLDPESLFLCDSVPLMDVPDFIRDYLNDHTLPQNFYTHVNGDSLLVDALEIQGQAHDLYYHDAENILIGNGAMNVFSALSHALCDPGDVLLTFSPTYILLAGCVQANGAELRVVESVYHPESGFKVTPEALDIAVAQCRREGRNVKGLLIVNPTNVDGQYWTEDEIESVQDSIVRNDLIVIEDRVYINMCFDQGKRRPAFFANNKVLQDRVITMDSASKRYGATQFRVGWAYGPKDIIDVARDYTMNSIWSGNARFQRATALALYADLPKDHPDPKNPDPKSKELYELGRKHANNARNYNEKLLEGYKYRRDLCLLIINGKTKYEELAREHNLFGVNTLLKFYQEALSRFHIDLEGIPGFNTPLISRATMFMLIELDKSLFEDMSLVTDDKDQLFHRLLHAETKVVLLPPSENTLPENERFYRMEYGVKLDHLLESLRRIQKFMRAWTAKSKNQIQQDIIYSYKCLPDKYKNKDNTLKAA